MLQPLENIDLQALVRRHGKKRPAAVKELRKLTGLGLAEAKEAIDQAYDFAELGGAFPTSSIQMGLAEVLKGGLGKALEETLMPGEKLIASLEGLMGQGIALTDTRVIIVKAGIAAGAMFGQKGKAFRLRDISSVEYSCALTEGRIQITTAGTVESQQGFLMKGQSFIDQVAASRQAENVCQFASNKKKQFQALRQLIQETIEAPESRDQTAAAAPAGQAITSIPDQIRALKELADMGAITSEEFERKKKELLARL